MHRERGTEVYVLTPLSAGALIETVVLWAPWFAVFSGANVHWACED